VTIRIHGHIAIIKNLGLPGEEVVRLNLDPANYQPYEPTRRASRHRLIGGDQAIQDFGFVAKDNLLSFSGITVTQAVAKQLDALYRAVSPVYTIRDWAGHQFSAFFAELQLGPRIDFTWGPTRTAAAGDTASITFDDEAVQVDDFYVEANVRLVSGTGVGQSRKVSAYDGESRVATVSPAWQSAPEAGTGYQIADVLHEVAITFWVTAVQKLFAGVP